MPGQEAARLKSRRCPPSLTVKKSSCSRHNSLVRQVQVADIARTEGQIAGEKARRDLAALNQACAELVATGKPFTAQDVALWVYNNGMVASGFGTGGKYLLAIQAATAAVQGLAGYIAEVIKQTTPDGVRVAAHVVVNAALFLAQGKNALACAAGAVTGEVVGIVDNYVAKLVTNTAGKCIKPVSGILTFSV